MKRASTKILLRIRVFSLGCTLFVFSAVLAGSQCKSSDDIDRSGGYVKNCGSSRVIVFVHGLFSDPEVWRNQTTHLYWPKMVGEDADPVFADTDIYVAGYDTPLKGQMTMTDLETQIVNRFDRDKVFSKHKEVVFIAHSMGGLLTQQILLTYRDRGFSEKVNKLFLYGTPQEGSGVANLARIFIPDLLLTELEAGDNNFVLHDLDQRWLHANFQQIQRFCAYETLREKGFKIVDKYSATRGCTGDTLAIREDHHHLVEPKDRQADAYTFVKNHLEPTRNAVQPGSAPKNSPDLLRADVDPRVRPTPYAEIEAAQREIFQLTSTWGEGIQRVSQDFANPYKRGILPGPIPTTLPDDLVENLASVDREVTFRYMVLEQTLRVARENALSCIPFSPNELIKDNDRFREADLTAMHPTSIQKLQTNSPAYNRFEGLRQYFDALKQKLGDYQCATK